VDRWGNAGAAGSREGAWGDPFHNKKAHTVRVYLQNIGGLPTSEDDDVKYTHMQQFLNMNKINVIALPECGTSWGKMLYKQRLQEQMQGWWESIQWPTAYNKQEAHPSRHQPGGMALGLLNKVVH